MLRYSSTMSRVLYLRANRRSIITNSSPSGHGGGGVLRVGLVERRQLLRGQRVRFSRGEGSHRVVEPVLLPVRRTLVLVGGHGAHHAGFVRKIQTAKLTIFLHRLIPLFFKDRPSLVMDLMHRSKPLGRRLDLRGAAYPHVHRHTKDCVGGELV
jgi:hypothetical protein